MTVTSRTFCAPTVLPLIFPLSVRGGTPSALAVIATTEFEPTSCAYWEARSFSAVTFESAMPFCVAVATRIVPDD